GARAVLKAVRIQALWSGYGQILRVSLEGGDWPSVIVKHISPPASANHPRGWDTAIGHQRKLRSYQVEKAWYRQHLVASDDWRTARFIAAKSIPNGQLIVMEDLDAAGFPERRHGLTMREMKACLSWLAHFHATYLGKDPVGLWEEGTYWHLDTRPLEWHEMREGPLKERAKQIDAVLKNCRYRTFVHGDAKVANFCFGLDGSVAAVDFQYVGGGCGMKDVAYFMSSCLDEDGCARHQVELLDHYFDVLRKVVALEAAETQRLEDEWRSLYPIAWADFTRFLEGWVPTHWKLHRYSRKMVDLTLKQL
ncbi:MAG: oxidoreductase family protein, partial [Bacteroidota bacterium]